MGGDEAQWHPLLLRTNLESATQTVHLSLKLQLGVVGMLGEFGGCFMGVSGAVSLGALLILAAWTLGVSATARLIIFTAWGPHRVTREWLVGRSRDSHRKGACRAVSAIFGHSLFNLF